MKTKIAQLFFTTVLLLTLNFGSDIGGPTIPPKPSSGPAFTATDSHRSFTHDQESMHKEVTRN